MIARINDVPVHYLDEGPPSGMPVVFLHGFPFSNAMWKGQIAAVSKVYRAIAPDLRGHGYSYVGDGQYTIDQHVDDVFALLDHLAIERAVVVGLSMGGYITLRALERKPERFTGAVLCDTRSEADQNETKLKRFAAIADVKRHGAARFAESFVSTVFAPATLSKRSQLVDDIRRTISRTAPLSIAGTLLALAARTDTTASLSNIKIPVLILVGEHDATTPPAASQAMHERIRNSEFHIIPEAAHMSNLENPEVFNEKLLVFLKRINPA
jgi:3-oxoadipate enol-lactonase